MAGAVVGLISGSRTFERDVDRAQQRGELDPSIDFLTAFDIIEGPLIVRSIFRPETLGALDIDALVERMLLALCRR